MVIVVAFIRSSGHIMHASINPDLLRSELRKEDKDLCHGLLSRTVHLYFSFGFQNEIFSVKSFSFGRDLNQCLTVN